MSLRRLAMQATGAAARLRVEYGIAPADAVCPFDLAERMGIVVRFVSAPSMEGMYSPDPRPTILVTTERPSGRRRYTCGHEVGHHVFGHGARLDELNDDPASWLPEEFIANRFASALLMPKLAVDSAFARRGRSIAAPSAVDVFLVSQDLGVGYVTLVTHMERTMACVSSATAQVLRRASLPRVRSQLAGFEIEDDLVFIDKSWERRPIDVEVGDIVVSADGIDFEGNCATVEKEPSLHLLAVAPGMGCVILSAGRSIPVRVSRREFAGLARFRHLEDPDDEQ